MNDTFQSRSMHTASVRLLAVVGLVAALLSLPLRADPEVTSGLKAYFAFNGNMADGSANNYALSLTGGVALTTDRFGIANGALGFANNVSFAAFDYGLAGLDFSIGAWLFQDHFSSMEAGGFAQGSVGEAGKAFRLMTDYYRVGVKYAFWFDDFDVNFTRDRSQWLHLFATFDDTTRERKIYIDGDLIATNIAAYGFSGTGPLSFGHMDGKFDEVRVYDRTLSPCEVGLIHSSESKKSVGDESRTIFLLLPLALVLGGWRRCFRPVARTP